MSERPRKSAVELQGEKERDLALIIAETEKAYMEAKEDVVRGRATLQACQDDREKIRTTYESMMADLDKDDPADQDLIAVQGEERDRYIAQEESLMERMGDILVRLELTEKRLFDVLEDLKKQQRELVHGIPGTLH